jgi:predicted RNase H-like HicB family nuclease
MLIISLNLHQRYRGDPNDMMKDVIYPAIFVKEEDEEGFNGYSVIFPDIQNAVTQGDDLADAFRMGTELLSAFPKRAFEDPEAAFLFLPQSQWQAHRAI